MKWQLQDAKARFSELIKRAAEEGAQIVTVHGQDTAVVLSLSDYERLGGRHDAFVDHLLEAPPFPDELIGFIEDRSRDLPRDVEL
jgi:prevent-host-death family protein